MKTYSGGWGKEKRIQIQMPYHENHNRYSLNILRRDKCVISIGQIGRLLENRGKDLGESFHAGSLKDEEEDNNDD